MEAIILAAGLGTRLRPLTENKPKALVEADGHTLLEININRLVAEGATRIAVNVHHFGEKVINYLTERKWNAEIVVSDELNMLLNTGAGVKKASTLLSGKEPIVVYNVDILSRISLNDMVAKHLANGAVATLAVSRRDTKRQLLFTPDGHLCGWLNRDTGETLYPSNVSSISTLEQSSMQAFAFSGIWVVSPQLLAQLPPADTPYPIIPELLQLSVSQKIELYEHRPDDWLDVGTPEKLAKASSFLDNSKSL